MVLDACVSDHTAGDFDESLTLSTAFLAAGATGVVGSRWEVPDGLTGLMMYVFHVLRAAAGGVVVDVGALGDDQPHTTGGPAGVVVRHVPAGDPVGGELAGHGSHRDPVARR
ncbi:hypothetical protein SMICM17S_12742 [Streptomyces microflavus]